MASERNLIVNADDLGMSEAVNAGIVEAHAEGIVTSASLMVFRPAAAAVKEISARFPRLAVGLHLEIAEWTFRDGEWRSESERCPPNDEAAVKRECRGQLGAFRRLLGRDPTHLDSHQHLHRSEPVASVAEETATELGVPLRDRHIRYEGGFYGQAGRGEPWPPGITVEHLIALIEELPAGWTELGCHPGRGVGQESSYAAEREVELRTLCDPGVAAAIAVNQVALRSFADVGFIDSGLPPHRALDSDVDGGR